MLIECEIANNSFIFHLSGGCICHCCNGYFKNCYYVNHYKYFEPFHKLYKILNRNPNYYDNSRIHYHIRLCKTCLDEFCLDSNKYLIKLNLGVL